MEWNWIRVNFVTIGRPKNGGASWCLRLQGYIKDHRSDDGKEYP